MLRYALLPCVLKRLLVHCTQLYNCSVLCPFGSTSDVSAASAMKLPSFTLAASLFILVFRSLLVHGQNTCLVQLQELESEPSACRGNFLLRVKPWYGRTGNNIISLANVIHLARLTYSEVIAGAHPFLKQTEWDFRVKSEKDKEQNITVLGAGTLGRQLAFTDDFYHESEMPVRVTGWSFGSTKQREVLINDVLPAMHLSPMHSRNAVVVHVRSGDVFTHSVIHPYYGQPPFAFYKSILQMPELTGREIILCVEDHINPVIDLIATEFSDRVRFVTDLHDGIATILGATHLVLARSTFSQSLGKMAPMLQAAYFPYCVEEDGRDKRDGTHDMTWNMPGYCYTYDSDYISLTGWNHSAEQIEMMATYSPEKVYAHPLPVRSSLTDMSTN